MLKKLDKHYVSSIDQKLVEFNNAHPLSASQRAELEKYERIFSLRDQANNEATTSKLWEDF